MVVLEVLLSLLAIAVVHRAIRSVDKRSTAVGLRARHFRRHLVTNDMIQVLSSRLQKRSAALEDIESTLSESLSHKQRGKILRNCAKLDDELLALDRCMRKQATKDRTILYLLTTEQMKTVVAHHVAWAAVHTMVVATLAEHRCMYKRLIRNEYATSVS